MESAIYLQKRRDITEPAENTAIAQEGGGDDKPRSQIAHESELRLHALVRQSHHIRNPLVNHIKRNDSQCHRHQERYSPGKDMTQKGAHRNTHQVGERHTGTHHRHRLSSLALLRHLHSHDGTRAEIGAMRKSLNKSGTEQKPVAWGNRCNDGSQCNQRSEKQENLLWSVLMHQDKGEGTGANAQRIDGDEMTSLRDGHVHIVRHIGEDSLDNKLCHAQGECAQSKCKQSFFHTCYPNSFYLIVYLKIICFGCKITKISPQ